MDPYVEDHLQWRLMCPGDMAALTELRRQIEAFDDTMISAVERLVGVDETGLDENCVGGWDNYGSLLAYGWNVVDPDPDAARVTLTGGVHPTQRFLSIGRNLLLWQQTRAVEWRDAERPGHDLELRSYVEAVQPGLRHVLLLFGFTEERHFIDMHRYLDDVPVPRDVDGISFVPFHTERSDELHDLHHLCFSADAAIDHDHWNKSLARVRHDWSWLAIDRGATVGYVLSGEDDAAAMDGVVEGWTGRFGVHPAHRRRGIASALLERTMVSMADSSCPGAGIGVDTTDPDVPGRMVALLGYEVRDSVLLMVKTMQGAKSVS
ncbi:GNAT family N-acetyltransferase [Tessaracoccus sp.]